MEMEVEILAGDGADEGRCAKNASFRIIPAKSKALQIAKLVEVRMKGLSCLIPTQSTSRILVLS